MMPDLECMEAARARFANWAPVDQRITAEESRQSSESGIFRRNIQVSCKHCGHDWFIRRHDSGKFCPRCRTRRLPKPFSIQASQSACERWKNAASADSGICDKTGVKHRFKRAGYNSRTKAPKKQCMDCKRASVIRPGDLVSGIQY